MSALFPMTAHQAQTTRRGKVLVGPVDLQLDGGGVCIVIGPNGAGKTTLLRLLHGTARLTSGTIDWACPLEEARNQQSFVFQRPVMLRRSVLENIAYPLRIRGQTRANAFEQARVWADRVGLGGMIDRSALVLSGGEQQNLAIARALITKPRLVFLDEPCASLDGAATREIEQILQDTKAAGTALVMSTHDMGQARRLADRVVFLLKGQVHEAAEADMFFEAPVTSRAAAFLRGDIVE